MQALFNFYLTYLVKCTFGTGNFTLTNFGKQDHRMQVQQQHYIS